MEYLKVTWIHEFDDEPILFYIEINDRRLETRKIEIYSDDSFGLASEDKVFGGTILSLKPIPPINEIMEDPQFLPIEIDKEEFESLWNGYLFYLIKS